MRLLEKILSMFRKQKVTEEKVNIIENDDTENEPQVIIRRYKRSWRCSGEKTDPVLSFFISDKPAQKFLLVEDETPGYWSIHFFTKEEYSSDVFDNFEEELLTDLEITKLISRISNHILPGQKLSSHGHISLSGIQNLLRFLDNGFEKTKELRKIQNSQTGKKIKNSSINKTVNKDDNKKKD